MTLLQSPLHAWHVDHGAKLAGFGGWEMPLEYAGGGVLKEHTAVREAVGLFDVSHLGTVLIRGDGARAFVNACLTGDLDRIEPGQAQYTLCCDDTSGGVVDDMIGYLRSDDEVLLVPNAANAADVAERLTSAAPAGIEVADQHRDYAVLAVQGPRSDDTLRAAGLSVDLAFMSFVDVSYQGRSVMVGRTGYTGERGYELVVPAADASGWWEALVAAGEPHGIAPCGLGARDTLRTEMGYPLHGQDLSLDTTPVQARLAWAVGWSKPAFWGKTVLAAERESGPKRRLRGLVAEGRGIARPGMPVLDTDGNGVGEVTSGTFSPTLRKGVALALLDSALPLDAAVQVDVRGRRETFVVTKPPFVPSSTH